MHRLVYNLGGVVRRFYTSEVIPRFADFFALLDACCLSAVLHIQVDGEAGVQRPVASFGVAGRVDEEGHAPTHPPCMFYHWSAWIKGSFVGVGEWSPCTLNVGMYIGAAL